ncbi:uncharacterized mitochondrial protein AtMg00820-like [Nicotiana tomentosiformis]|uniref:uncharacterized mitochondrial protein AtMg00820-like n=1 Tax=Nicotiana tomentosiformis TaxID=4098 RepID=UPI00388C36C7
MHDHVQAGSHGRPSRTTRPPIWLSDYVTSAKPKAHCSYPISQYVTYTHLNPTYQAYLGSFSVPTEPRSFKEASKDRKTWELVPLPAGKRAIGSKWVYKIMYKDNEEIDKYRACLVAKRYTQREGLDYHETSPQLQTVRTVISVAASKN